MSVRIIKTTRPKARKKYICRACEAMLKIASKDEILNQSGLNTEEVEVMRNAMFDDKCCIQIGEVYECQYNEFDGHTYYWRAKTEVIRIATRHGLLSQDY